MQQDQPSTYTGVIGDLARARAFIALVDSLFKNPNVSPAHAHQYLPRKHVPEPLRAEWDWMAELVDNGYKAMAFGTVWNYVDLDGHAYWRSLSWYGPDKGERTVLNRRSLDLPRPSELVPPEAPAQMTFEEDER
jgi:hypothetical protein